MGLNDGADQLSCHLRFLESMYAENMLLLFSCVFPHDVEQNVRYPIINNNKVTLPIDNFYTPIIEDGLKTTIPVLRTILNSIVGNSVLQFIWELPHRRRAFVNGACNLRHSASIA